SAPARRGGFVLFGSAAGDLDDPAVLDPDPGGVDTVGKHRPLGVDDQVVSGVIAQFSSSVARSRGRGCDTPGPAIGRCAAHAPSTVYRSQFTWPRPVRPSASAPSERRPASGPACRTR